MDDAQRICVIGAGSWGTALAVLLVRNGNDTILWGRDPRHIGTLIKDRRNEAYLPGIEFPESLQLSSDPKLALENRDIVLVAVPSHAFVQILQAIQPHLTPTAKIAWATKGLDHSSHRLFDAIAEEILPPHTATAVLSGPTFALEVASDLPAAITVASKSTEFASTLAKCLRNTYFRVYTSQDVIGVQLGGAIKNVLAIATGVADGLGFGANTRAALVTRGLAEMMRLGLALGGQTETFMGLTGLGDLVLTCTDDQSRNRRFGLGIGQGRDINDVIKEIGQEIEGIPAARTVYEIGLENQIDMPISEQTHKVLHEYLHPSEAVNNLLDRKPKAETVF